MRGSVRKFGAITPGLFRGPFAELPVTHDSARRKKPGSIYLGLRRSQEGGALGRERAQHSEDMTRAQCHWSPSAMA